MTNNTPTHTPLPWHISTDKLAIMDTKYNTVCGLDYESRSDKPIDPMKNHEANAEFIARACNAHYELLEALQETHLLLSGLELEGRLPKLGKEQRAKIFNINAQAIKKAKGEA